METRNILDQLGNIIGELTLPDGTSEDDWTAALSLYSTTASVPDVISDVTTLSYSATDSVSTSSSTPSTLGSMTCTPPAGKYIILFNGSIATGGASASGEFGIYVDGTLLPETKRPISCNLTLLGGLVTISLNTIGVGTYTGTEVTVNGQQVVDVRFRSTNSGTITFNERVMSLIKASQ